MTNSTSSTAVSVYAYATPTNSLAWTGTLADDTAPIAFIAAIQAWLPTAVAGDRLSLGNWHYAELA